MNKNRIQKPAERFGIILSIGLITAVALVLDYCSGKNIEAARWNNKGIALSDRGQPENTSPLLLS